MLTFSKIKTFFLRHIKKPYYMVPPCPVCQSPVTGRYVRLSRDNVTEWQMDEALAAGELIQPISEMSPRNCFCVNCGYEWIGDVTFKLYSLEEINKQKIIRHTREILTERKKIQREEYRNDRSMFRGIKRFIGKI